MPDRWDEWKDVANERMTDAVAMLPQRHASVGPIYMAGYAVECSLKALLMRRGRAFPSRGSEGHNLRALWRDAGLALRDVGGSLGTATYYVESWSTDLRYETVSGFPGACDEMLQGAKLLVARVHRDIGRERKRRRHDRI